MAKSKSTKRTGGGKGARGRTIADLLVDYKAMQARSPRTLPDDFRAPDLDPATWMVDSLVYLLLQVRGTKAAGPVSGRMWSALTGYRDTKESRLRSLTNALASARAVDANGVAKYRQRALREAEQDGHDVAKVPSVSEMVRAMQLASMRDLLPEGLNLTDDELIAAVESRGPARGVTTRVLTRALDCGDTPSIMAKMRNMKAEIPERVAAERGRRKKSTKA